MSIPLLDRKSVQIGIGLCVVVVGVTVRLIALAQGWW